IGLCFFGNTPKAVASPAPNPYTVTLTNPATGLVTFHKPQSYQIISPGVDGRFGVGGQFDQSSTSAAAIDPLPIDASTTQISGHNSPVTFFSNSFQSESSAHGGDPSVRRSERDNLTNFKSGPLQ